MEVQSNQNLVERIADLLQESKKGSDETLRSSLDKINQRLDFIESKISVETFHIQTADSKFIHSSQEKFANLEELADEIINGSQTEKACPYEPTGKPCDNCAMCDSRGF